MNKLVYLFPLFSLIALCLITGCGNDSTGGNSTQQPTPPAKSAAAPAKAFTGVAGEVKIITLDPGHFHAALVQKIMYPQVDPTVTVYAPDGPDVQAHLARIEGYNTREKDPTQWNEAVYRGDDFARRMIAEKKGNVVVLSGNNRKKAQYIKECVAAGLNVLADKPMCIDQDGYKTLLEAFDLAQTNGVLIYDIMTERSEITSILQRELVQNSAVFGQIQPGAAGDPAIINESVHHFYKLVSGKPLVRPAWFFDATQQGEGIVDVTTHLIDLITWGLHPDKPLTYGADIKLVAAKRWPEIIGKEDFCKVTASTDYPDYLKTNLDQNGALPCFSNGEITFTLGGVFARAKVVWKFQAPQGAGDTHFAVFKGSNADIIIEQDKAQNYRPELYVAAKNTDAVQFEATLTAAVEKMKTRWPGIELVKSGERWQITIPDTYRVGHEAHFGEVTERYLKYLVDGKLPDWEIPNMITKYALTTNALKLAREQK